MPGYRRFISRTEMNCIFDAYLPAAIKNFAFGKGKFTESAFLRQYLKIPASPPMFCMLCLKRIGGGSWLRFVNRNVTGAVP